MRLAEQERAMTTVAVTADQTTTRHRGYLAAMALGALGVVYGDIGTSPLYTFKTALEWAGGEATPAVALGMLSSDRVDAHHHDVDQIRRNRYARRQRRRGRHSGVDVACSESSTASVRV